VDKIGFIGGSSLFNSEVLKDGVQLDSSSNVLAISKNNFTFIQRHGAKNVSPHLIDYTANLQFLKDSGVVSVVSIVSVGSLSTDLEPGTICLASDFISFYNIVTSNESLRMHLTPTINKDLKEKIKVELNVNVKDVVYWQTTGPRFETPAEISLIQQFADVVGMTMGSECTIAAELGLKYVAVCVIDNYCNGIVDKSLDYSSFEKMVSENQVKTDEMIGRLMNVFAG